MALSTTIREEFKSLVAEICEGLTNEQVFVRTGVSSEYIRKWRLLGLVPKEDQIRKFATGMKADLKALRVAAGYDPEPDVVCAWFALRGVENMPEQGKQQIMQFVRERKAQYGIEE